MVRKYGLGERNEAGDNFVQFCKTKQLSILYTQFQYHKCLLYTWTSPNGMYHNQTDYICIGQRWKSTVFTLRTKPGVDCGSNHKLLTRKTNIKLCKKIIRCPSRNDIEKCTQDYCNRVAILDMGDREPNGLWKDIKTIISEESEKNITDE